MIAQNEPQKWEYKVVNIQVHKSPTGGQSEQATKVAALLNSNGQDSWELVSTINSVDNILPEGFVVLKRQFQAPKVESKRWYESARPKVTVAAKAAAPVVAKAVTPPAVKPIVAVAAALSPTAGKTDANAATA